MRVSVVAVLKSRGLPQRLAFVGKRGAINGVWPRAGGVATRPRDEEPRRGAETARLASSVVYAAPA